MIFLEQKKCHAISVEKILAMTALHAACEQTVLTISVSEEPPDHMSVPIPMLAVEGEKKVLPICAFSWPLA